jgi:hypothetical protein
MNAITLQKSRTYTHYNEVITHHDMYDYLHRDTLAQASMRGRAMLDPVRHATYRTVDQTGRRPHGVGACRLVSPWGWLSNCFSSISMMKSFYIIVYHNDYIS